MVKKAKKLVRVKGAKNNPDKVYMRKPPNKKLRAIKKIIE